MGSNSSSTSSMSSVESIIQSNDIVVFSSSGCPYCRDAITSLKATGKKFEVIEANSEQRSQLYAKTNVSSVPNIWVKGKFVGGKLIFFLMIFICFQHYECYTLTGCNDGPESWMGIKKLIRNGQLEQMLQA